MSRRQSIYMNYRASREKLGRPPIKDHRWKQKFLRWHLFETPINSKTTDGLLINLTRSPRKKDARGHPTPSEIASFCPRLPSECPLLSVGKWGGGGGGGRVWIFSGTTHSGLTILQQLTMWLFHTLCIQESQLFRFFFLSFRQFIF